MIDGRRAARWLAVLSLAASVLATRGARAAGDDAEVRSRQLFKQGDALGNSGKWSEACPLFQAAHELHATGGTALRTADCYEKVGKYDRALEMYQYILDHRATEKEPERVTLAEGRVAALKQQIGPGLSALPPPIVVQEAPPGLSPAPPPPSRVPAAVAFGIGGFGAVVGGVFGALALVERGKLQDACPHAPSCPANAKNTWNLTMASAWASNAGFVVALAGVITGIVLLAKSSSPARRQAVENTLGPGGLTVHF